MTTPPVTGPGVWSRLKYLVSVAVMTVAVVVVKLRVGVLSRAA